MATLAEIRAKAQALLEKADNAETVEERDKLDEELDNVVNEYTAESKKACYDECRNSDNPMHTAILKFEYPSIKVKVNKDKDTGIVTRSIEDTTKPIELGDLHKKLGGVGVDTKWLAMAETINFHMAVRASQRLNTTINCDADIIKKIHADIDLGKNPVSNTNLLKTLDAIIKAMLGDEYKAVSHDVNYLCDVYVNDNKRSKTGVSVADHKTFRRYLKKVCYRVLTNGKGYDVECKEVEKLYKA